MSKRKIEPCEDCNSSGWDIFDVNSTGYLEVERCDNCQRFKSDEDAEAAVPPGVVALLARLNKGAERPI